MFIGVWCQPAGAQTVPTNSVLTEAKVDAELPNMSVGEIFDAGVLKIGRSGFTTKPAPQPAAKKRPVIRGRVLDKPGGKGATPLPKAGNPSRDPAARPRGIKFPIS